VEWALRLCIALFRFWDMREHFTEGQARLETALRLAGEGHVKERAKISVFLGALVTSQGNYAAAREFLEQGLLLYKHTGDQWGIAAALNALAISARDRGDYASAQINFENSLTDWRALNDRISIARCLHNLANVLRVRGDYAAAQRALEEATSIFDALGDRSGAAWSLNQQGDLARERGDMTLARDLYGHALSEFRQLGDRWGTARSLADLGYIYCEQEDYLAAHAAFREALEMFAGLGHRRGIARTLEGIACLAVSRGHARRALTLASAAAHLRRVIGAPLPQAEQRKLDEKLAVAWEALTDDEAQRAWADGSAMNVEKAIQYSFDQPRSASSGEQDR
jgi:tetratricopeptide (TPR) repeat protein